MEHKTFPAFVTKVDEDEGLIETIFAVMGNLDKGKDIIHPGAFTKTFIEHGPKVKVLDLHKADSILRVLGKPVSFKEIGKAELPTDLLTQFPDATGGAWARIQFNLKTQAGHDAFQHLKAGDVDEWSFGYDPVSKDYSKVGKVKARNLREIKLYELSPVIWGMNPATSTLSAKMEAKPVEETENTIRIRVRNPDDFQEDSFSTIDISKDEGIQAVIGKLAGETSTTVQSYIFDKEKWTVAEAEAWVEEHKKSAISFIEAFSREQRESELFDELWKIDSALREAIQSIARDSTLDDEAKQAQLQESLSQYSEAMTSWFATALAANYFKLPEGKEGRVLSAANAEHIASGVKNLISVLEAAGVDIDGKSVSADTTHPAKAGAEPDDENLLRRIEIGQKQLELLALEEH